LRAKRAAIHGLLILLLTAGCAREPELTRYRLAAFGTEVTITVRSGIDLSGALRAIDRELQAMHRRWHAWDPGMLADINQAIAQGRTVEITDEALEVIVQARQLEQETDGLFNPAIGRLLTLWGFHASELPEGPPPAVEAIAQLVEASPSMSDLRLRGRRLSSRNPAVQLDFGAYVKGLGVERALELLAKAGIEHAIVNAGGDLGVIGHRGGRPWRAAVQHPNGSGGKHLASLELRDGDFAFTSGNYRRYRRDEGLRHGHIIDPRDGHPADHVASVTVIGRAGGRTDAAATALAVAGPDEWQDTARALGIRDVLRIEADGSAWLTQSMAERIQWQEAPEQVRVLPADAARERPQSARR
jgi:thiamine biosynthesis lipoprotein